LYYNLLYRSFIQILFNNFYFISKYN